MFKSTSELNTAAYNVLVEIRDTGNPGEKTALLSDDNFDYIIKHIAEKKYVDGLHPRKGALGTRGKVTSYAGTPILTEDGLRFIETYNA